jgi:hypothetical protein
MSLDPKILGKKFIALDETFDDKTLIVFTYHRKKLVVKIFVNDEKHSLFRVNKQGLIKVARYFANDIRRQDKFDNDGKLLKANQYDNDEESGSQVRLRGNKKTWMHKDRDNNVKQILKDLFDGQYNLLVGPSPGVLGLYIESLKRYGNALRSEYDIKKETIKIKLDGDNLEVSCGDKTNFVSFPLSELK